MYKNESGHKKILSSSIDKPYTQRTGYFSMKPQLESQRQVIDFNENIYLQDKHYEKQNIPQGYSQRKHNKYINKNKQLQQKLKIIKPRQFQEHSYNENNLTKNKQYEFKHFQKKLDKMIEKKVEEMVEKYCQKYFDKFKDVYNLTMVDLIKDVEKDIKTKVHKIQKGYDYILDTYDNFLKIVQTMKEKTKRKDKYIKKKEFQVFAEKYEEDIVSMRDKITKLSSYLEQNIKIQRNSSPMKSIIESPYIFDSETQLQAQELKTIVSTYNQNFLKIEKKLNMLFSYI